MERTKYLLITLLAFVVLYASGQTNPTIYKAFISGNISLWKDTIDTLDAKPQKNNAQKLELINYQYGYIAYCIDKENEDEANLYLRKAEKLIGQLEQQKYKVSMLYAYKAAFIGFKIGISPYKAPFIGPESLKFAQMSVKLDSTNALGYIQLGNISFYSPVVFGGSKTTALNHYLKALELMEKNPARIVENWNYLNLYVTLINTYFELEKYEQAKTYSLRALTIEPKFEWIRHEIYPKVLSELNDD